MKFKLKADEYELFKKYVDISDMKYILQNDDDHTIFINNEELHLFQLLISTALDIYGFDSDGEITEFGRQLEALYDTIYNQI
ncbi:hypothetical protein [Ruminococcus sp. Marseille-P6503]|uniref:hypothetical protein n=1 Tax=Ruminococcus sp. Marseille-P6503 TaxID=2364796 RepID=UPI000F542A20|nr:hypothetical protein [Ruminococcus sp. Marseille-P6503]